MRNRFRFNIVAAMVISFFIATVAMTMQSGAQPTTQPDRPDRGQRGPRGGGGIPQNVEGAMKGVNRAMRQLRRQIADTSKRDDNLKLIGDMERNAVIAKSMPVPDEFLEKAKTDDEKDKLKNEYRGDLITVVRKFLDLEQSVIDGKTDQATQQLDEIQKLRDASHEKLGVKDDDHDK